MGSNSIVDARVPLFSLGDFTGNLYEAGRPGRVAVRPDDLVAVRFELRGLEIVPGNPPTVRKHGSGAAYLILHFPPQSFAEEVFYEAQPDFAQVPGETDPPGGASEEPREPPVRARIAEESRVAFRVPDGFQAEYTIPALLAACEELPPSVAANAGPGTEANSFSPTDLLGRIDVRRLSRARRAGLASQIASMVRIGFVQGDLSTLRAREASSRLTYLGRVDRKIGRRVPRVRISPPTPRPPGSTVTAIEIPWRLILSPHAETRWRHSATPVTSPLTQRTELWHSRLIAPRPDRPIIEPPYPDGGRTVRAIWARSGSGFEDADPPMQSGMPVGKYDLPEPGETTFRMTLDDRDRFQISHLSSNFAFPRYNPEPVSTNLMMLSALGGWLDCRGAWDLPALSLEEWVHRATMGRDHYVRVVYRGFLFPTGHRVALIKESQRKFHHGKSGDQAPPGNVAYLRQRFYIVIREKDRLFDSPDFLDAVSKDGKVRFARQFPFSRIRLLTDATPDLDDPNDDRSDVANLRQNMFWPMVAGQPFRFQCVGTDLDGRRIPFDLPMIFVEGGLVSRTFQNNTPDYAAAESYAQVAANEYDSRGRNTADLSLQRVAMAPSSRPGDTSFETQSLQFGGVVDPGNQAVRNLTDRLARPIWLPRIVASQARIGVVANLTGSGKTSELTYNPTFLEVGFDEEGTRNKGEIFLNVGKGPNLDFSAQGDRSGGFVQPNLSPAAFSRFAGPVMSDPAQFILGEMPEGAGFPTSLGDLPLPLLFGCIPLADIIDAVGDVVKHPEKVPKFVQEVGTAIETFVSAMAGLYSLLSELAAQPSRLGQAALEVFRKTLIDLQDQVKAYAAAQMAPVDAAINDAAAKLTALGTKLGELAKVSIEGPVSAPLTALASPLAQARSSLTALQTAANASPGGVEVPAGLRQGLMNLVAKADALLAGIEGLSTLVSAGKSVWDALDAIIGDPSELTKLLGDPAALGPKLNALKASLGPLRSELESFSPLDGAPKQAILAALDRVKQVLEIEGGLTNLLQQLTGEELVVRFDWNPEISDWYLPTKPDQQPPVFRANDKRGFVVAVEARVKKSDGSAKIGVACGLKHFDLVLLGPASFLELNFEKIEFRVDHAAKMDVDVLLTDIKFVGPLSFVETLRDLIPLDGFSDPPYLDITPKGIDAGFDVALPSITLGVLNLSNLSLGAGFTVPFIGQPLSVRFNFCRREQPFLLTVYMFGGGGFFGVTVDPSGVQVLEAAFEFGAAISIDFGVASGGVHVMAGLYYRMEKDAALLAGYFRLGGHVDVLGLITASLELYLELNYETQSGKCVGRAQLTIEVKVFVFSGSVTISCERKFAGANGDPSLRQMLGHDATVPLAEELAAIEANTQYAWRDHLEAFA